MGCTLIYLLSKIYVKKNQATSEIKTFHRPIANYGEFWDTLYID